jgi:hypothetical protein
VTDRQVKLYDVREPLETALDSALSRKALIERKLRIGLVRMARAMVPGKNRSPGVMLRQVFGNVLEGVDESQPRVKYLVSTLDRLREANIPTLLWIAPINVDHMREEQVATEPIARSAATLARLAQAHGATLVDLHAVLRDAEFRDYSDHIQSIGTPPATQRIGRLLARVIASTATAPLRPELLQSGAEGDHALQ